MLFSKLDILFIKHNVINTSLYGFQNNKSGEEALLHIKVKIIDGIENKLYALGLFPDFRKAFDTVQHDTLP